MTRFEITLVLVTAAMGCAADDDDDETTIPGASQLAATLAPVGGFAVTGSANVTWRAGDGQFSASIVIANDVPRSTRPWHVHFGTCSTGGDIVGPAGSYEALVVGETGTAQSAATVAFELDAAVPYHVNVHESPTSLATIVACGNLGGGGGGDDVPPPDDNDPPY